MDTLLLFKQYIYIETNTTMNLILAVSLFLLQSGVSLAQSNSTGCSVVDPSVDYFFDKVAPVASLTWSIEYFNTYKIITNSGVNETYLLYQCGSEIPQDEIDNGNHAAFVQIPVSTVGIGVTTIIPQLEQLGVVDSIIAFTTDPTYASSPCLLENIANGEVIVLQSRDEFDNYTATPEITQETLDKLVNTIGFTDGFTESPPFNVSVKVTEYLETTNAGIFEWIKFFSAFYNLEAKANEIFDTTETRWDCVSESASLAATSDDKPNVLWMTYVSYCGGWDIGTCPNYYCEYAEQCSATFIATTLSGNFSEECQANYYSIDEVVEIGKDADYWFYLAPDWNTTYGLFQDKLDSMSVVQEKKVYDYQGSGPGAWFETRAAEYFIVLQDFCSVVGTVPSSLTVNRTYFRNVMDGSPVGSIGTECTESSRSNSILPVVGAVCVDLNLPEVTKAPTLTPPTQTPPTQTPPTPVASPTSSASTIGHVVGLVLSVIVAAAL